MTRWVLTCWVLQLCFLHLADATHLSNETDRLALLEFKSKISGDPLGVLSSWNDSRQFCFWGGVSCSRRHVRVTVLDLHSSRLSGSISPHIGNLTFLKKLDLNNNTFHGAIPPEIGRLRRLRTLFLYNNSLGGEIPSNISGCSDNKLVGSLPRQLGFLYGLQFFHAGGNRLTGSILPSFGNLTSIRILALGDNQLSGRVPEALGKLKKSLEELLLHRNYLDGEIPSSIFNLTLLTLLSLGENRLRGNLPWNMGTLLPNLENFYVPFNQLTGRLPPSLSNASNMVQLQLQVNNFTGSVPSMASSHNLLRLNIAENFLGSGKVNGDDLGFLSTLTNARKLQALVISINNFGGSLPEQIGNLSSSIEILVLDNNQISGSIPEGLQNLVNLEVLLANGNKLSGAKSLSIIGNMQSLVQLRLDNNDIVGYVPLSIGNLNRLLVLRLANNHIDGEIPTAIQNCKSLIFLDLSNNNLSGVIPTQLMGLTSLSIGLNLSYNHFTGSIPIEVENLKNLGSLDLSHNMLSDSIPRSLGKCVSLESVQLQANLLRGMIPLSLDSLRGIRLFDLSNNNLSGQIPKFFEQMHSLQLLNLSHNKFEGEVPTEGVLNNSIIILVIGNVNLCGGLPELNLPPCNLRRPKKRLSYKLKVCISTVSSMILLIFIASSLLVFWMKSKGKQHIVSSGDDFHTRVSYQSLHKATNGFSTTNLIGVGSFGSVYKGVVNINVEEITIAVKVFNLQHRGASKSFMTECEVLKNIRHRNLVRILTVCSGVDYQGNDFKALVYEFVVNGRRLKFHQRLNVAINIASALDYIHNLCETPIVHCDLKPDNVLLDEDMVAHVGDFGLARFLESPAANLSLNGETTSSIGIKGTVGYAPPGIHSLLLLE
ncbi:unnamed protein product [Linum tenue]|uniref:non-specific serine/threonine protein kinase n=1 Tax=Linum tenue TaxID=586396 RepID=A0AAV0S2H9_9ROSI|nr:unnamed protein product [Linum tenue]